jgi:dienelactone hydrolase
VRRISILILMLISASSSIGAEKQTEFSTGGMPQWVDSAPYSSALSENVLRRSIYFMPLFGAVYPEKFEVLLRELPSTKLRGVVIYNHGCGGQWVNETNVSRFFYRLGFAVIAPEFPTREGNKLGCAGGNSEEAMRSAAERAREGIFTAKNPARLAGRASDVMEVVKWLKMRTQLPILIGGHSEGCRTTYSLHLEDPQIVGGICVKQGLQTTYEHTWRWNSKKPMWQSLEEHDPWVVFPPGATAKDVTFERKFESYPANLTVIIVPGRTHHPLNQESEQRSLINWLDTRIPKPPSFDLKSFDYEPILPEIQRRLRP